MPHPIRPLLIGCAMALLLPLTACSPHPATGYWITAQEPASGFNRLEVNYEGQALLFEVGEKEAGRRCFWGGESAQSIRLTCKPAFNTELDERYRLTLHDSGGASLLRDEQVVAQLVRAPHR